MTSAKRSHAAPQLPTVAEAEIIASTPDEFLAHLKRETHKWAKVIKEANIRAD